MKLWQRIEIMAKEQFRKYWANLTARKALYIICKLNKNCGIVLITGTVVSLCIYICNSLHRHLLTEHR